MSHGPEAGIKASIMQYLRMRGHLVKVNQSGAMTQEYEGKKRFIKMGEAGWPDIIGCTGNKYKDGAGWFLGIEVKAPGNKTTEKQDSVLLEIKSRNGLSLVAYSVDDVISAGL